jgi:hypothetical protein
MSTEGMPPLPKPAGNEERSAWPGLGRKDFTADQVLAYGRLCAEECAKSIDADLFGVTNGGARNSLKNAAASIRKRFNLDRP